MRIRQLHIGLLLVLLTPLYSIGQGVSQSRHNLSVSGKGAIKSLDSDGICKHCHTSHIDNPKKPMWNRKQSGAIYTLYDSSTLDAKPGQPDGASILCLSCHDGTVALGTSFENNKKMSFSKSMSKRGNLGTDLSDDHPISFVYDSYLASQDGELKDPSTLPRHILDNNDKLQCTSCHDSHKDINGDFLKRTNEFSDLCFTCHDTSYWGNSSHNTASTNWNGVLPNPWNHLDSPYATVSQNGCANCHDNHNANSKNRLLKARAEEDNCLDCHNGNVADKNILAEFTKPFKHDIFLYSDVHDPIEADIALSKHVECVDCHNAHAAQSIDSQAPFVKGGNIGVRGINQSGSPVNEATYEYEICFRCHSDNPMVNETTKRYLGSENTLLDFSPNNISFHPVISEGKNITPRGLNAPLNENSIIYCSSCHSSDGTNAAKGPHGSNYPRILKAQYNLDKTPQLGPSWPTLIQTNYALCFECHDNNKIINIHTNIANGHFMETIGCNSCHDPHGYEGGNQSEHSYLVNFDQSVIQPNPLNGRMIDLDTKKCFMTCHDPRGVVNYTHKAEGSDY